MKKYMIAATALLLFAGITNAQVAQKQPSKTTVKKEVANTKINSVSTKNAVTTATVSPSSKKTTSANTAIKRKHHYKKNKATSTTGKK